MLFQAENSKNNALTQHNINDQNYMIANSMRIESDPLSALDSSNFVTQTSKLILKLFKVVLKAVSSILNLFEN
ncbi:putative conjugative transfer protein TraN [Orientia tsutsugamushi str. UT76]|nr:putative conjugative transfer protein TraN [Orientia tsutsugamushi str. UT76]